MREALVVPLAAKGDADHHYLVLRKRGYTTMEAVRLIAAEFGLHTRDVGYAGLKDEDGVTEQLVSLPAGAAESALPFRYEDGDRWLRLSDHGHGDEPLRIGALEGNGFRIVVRDLDPAFAEELAARRKVNHFFLNYYDIQRFGVPGGPRTTHHVGAALLAGDWERALAELVRLGAPESPAAAAWSGSPRAFFLDLDPRTTAFYLAASASHDWNARLAELVARTCGDRAFATAVEGVPFTYARSPRDAVDVLRAAGELPYLKYTFIDGTPKTKQSSRQAVVQTTIAVGPAVPDEHFPGRSSTTLAFFLPSGCYATSAVRQLFAHN
ncbi:tRNA pseudouridine(13) synthase TruD [Actinokineospora soli]|uniref:tRNA pseudouridine(13) synthase TruD n=1 Tax=Actinokineospora soli TaxID=1048753 RepID=A0ABW2TV67_9PSEU